MNDRETRRYDMFGRVQTFGTDNTPPGECK